MAGPWDSIQAGTSWAAGEVAFYRDAFSGPEGAWAARRLAQGRPPPGEAWNRVKEGTTFGDVLTAFGAGVSDDLLNPSRIADRLTPPNLSALLRSPLVLVGGAVLLVLLLRK